MVQAGGCARNWPLALALRRYSPSKKSHRRLPVRSKGLSQSPPARRQRRASQRCAARRRIKLCVLLQAQGHPAIGLYPPAHRGACMLSTRIPRSPFHSIQDNAIIPWKPAAGNRIHHCGCISGWGRCLLWRGWRPPTTARCGALQNNRPDRSLRPVRSVSRPCPFREKCQPDNLSSDR